jgi:hypothetical protein
LLAFNCLNLTLVKPVEEDEIWQPDMECLLMRSEVRLKMGDRDGALEDALYVTDNLPLDHIKTRRAIVLKANAMFAKGDLEHALMFFYRVKKLTCGRDRKANMGIQRCLDSINSAVAEIKIKNMRQPDQGGRFGPQIRITGDDQEHVKKIKESKKKKTTNKKLFSSMKEKPFNDDVKFLKV